MDLLHCFAQNVRKIRNERGYSQEYLAELAGLHRTYISALERERRNISIENVERIADAFIAQIKRAYYLDIPTRYNQLNNSFPKIHVKQFGEFFFEWKELLD